jgi:hypothetical protein
VIDVGIKPIVASSNWKEKEKNLFFFVKYFGFIYEKRMKNILQKSYDQF